MGTAALDIISCILDSYPFPSYGMGKKEFAQVSYTRWALDELRNRLCRADDSSIISVIEEFIAEMDEYACVRHDNNIMFSVSYDIAIHVLDVLLQYC